jgi:hypothetical protein
MHQAVPGYGAHVLQLRVSGTQRTGVQTNKDSLLQTRQQRQQKPSHNACTATHRIHLIVPTIQMMYLEDLYIYVHM